MKIPTVCNVPGCPELTTHGRCQTHRREAERARGSAASRGYDARWRRTRGRYLQLHQVCEETGCTQRATEVHHIDGLGPNGPDGHRHKNLRALCKPHHSQLTSRLQPGGWNR